MAHRFRRHYTQEEARALLPQVREWLGRLDHFRRRLEQLDQRIDGLMQSGSDTGGETVNVWVRTIADMQEVLALFAKREIQIKDIERGLVDFPAIIGGREVFLCWERGEEDIEFWHDIDSGYAGRERL